MALPIAGDICVCMYRRMLAIRKFEERAVELHREGLIRGNIHTCIGQEAVSVGTCLHLRDDDYITSTHRGHGYCLAKNGDPLRMMAELMGKRTGYCKGKGGSMHIADFERGNLGANGIVGGGLPTAVGAGISIQNRDTDQISVCFFGDGASNQGTFHESINLASIWRLPVIFACVNNQYALSTPVNKTVATTSIAERGAAYGIAGMTVDGNDVIEVYLRSSRLAADIREGAGPVLLEYNTYRLSGHYVGDPGDGALYRPNEELESWQQKCPIRNLRSKLEEEGLLNENMVKEIESDVDTMVEEAVDFAVRSPFPSSREAMQDLFVDAV